MRRLIQGMALVVTWGAVMSCVSGPIDEAGTADDMLGTSTAPITIDISKRYEIKGIQSGKCVQPQGGNTGAGTAAVITACSGGAAQQYSFISQGSGYYSIKNASSGLCLDVADASTASGALINHYNCSGGTYQQFLVTEESSGKVSFKARHSGLAIDVIGGATANGTGLQQWGYSGGDYQLFALTVTGTGSDPCALRLSDTPIGYAAQGGGTTGGGTAAPIQITTTAQLQQYLEDSSARVLHVMNDLDFRTAARTVAGCEKKAACTVTGTTTLKEFRAASSTCNADEVPSTRTRNDTTISVKSNKTVIGRGDGVSLRGVSFNLGSSQNLIFRNLEIYDVNPGLIEAGDGFTLTSSKRVWIDHCKFRLISDGSIDIGTNAFTDAINSPDLITVSYSHFDGRTPYQCGGQHHYINFADQAKMTYHHNWFDTTSGRNPKLGGALTQAHLFNNYWLNTSYFCTTVEDGAQVRIESNYFENASKPHWLQNGGIAIDGGNLYTGGSVNNTRDTGGTVFSVPYSYTKTSAETARSNIIDCAGLQQIQ